MRRLVMNSWWGRALWRCRWLHTYYIHFSKLLVSSCVQKVSISGCSFSHSSICLAHSPGCVFWVQMSLAEMDQGIKHRISSLEQKPLFSARSVCGSSAGEPNRWNDQRCLYPLTAGLAAPLGAHTPCVTCHCHSTAQPFIPAAAATWPHLQTPQDMF